jgi:hypothetical protein
MVKTLAIVSRGEFDQSKCWKIRLHSKIVRVYEDPCINKRQSGVLCYYRVLLRGLLSLSDCKRHLTMPYSWPLFRYMYDNSGLQNCCVVHNSTIYSPVIYNADSILSLFLPFELLTPKHFRDPFSVHIYISPEENPFPGRIFPPVHDF